MTAWLVAKCLYIVAGGLVTPGIVTVVFGREKPWGDFGDPLAAFVAVIGVLLMWPMLLAVLIDAETRK